MSLTSLLFAFIVTPAGTTTLELVFWLAFFLFLIFRDSRGGRGVVVERSSSDVALLDSLSHPTLRRLPVSKVFDQPNAASAERISDKSNDADDSQRPLDKSPPTSLTRLSTLKYAKLAIIAYALDAVLFLMISMLMHKSILFIPTPCSNVTATAVCDYSFGFDREFYWANPRNNDTLHAVFMGAKGSPALRRRNPILFTHGNSYNVAHKNFVQQYAFWNRLGFDVYAWDYPNYGKSRLNPTSEMTLQRFHEDAEYVLEKVSQVSMTNSKNVILWGFSMGGAISAAIAMQRPVNIIVLQFPPDRFDWVVREGTKITGWLSSLPQYKILDLFSLLTNVRTPTRVLHLAAEYDHYVTHARQQRLFEQLAPHVRARSRFVTISNVGHDGNPLEDERMPGILESFLAEEF